MRAHPDRRRADGGMRAEGVDRTDGSGLGGCVWWSEPGGMGRLGAWAQGEPRIWLSLVAWNHELTKQ